MKAIDSIKGFFIEIISVILFCRIIRIWKKNGVIEDD